MCVCDKLSGMVYIPQTEERCCWQQCGPRQLCQIVVNHTSVPAVRPDRLQQREPDAAATITAAVPLQELQSID